MGRTMAVVLFTDLVGSTELRGRLGEEAADELRRRHDRLLTQAVEANNGRVVKGLGDGIMATFGGASDAVGAAVAIQQTVARLNRSGKAAVPLAVRVGLSAGDVTLEDDDVHGTPVIEASRLCGAAEGGEVLIAEVVRILAALADALLRDKGPLELKGLERPVPAWAVQWEPAAVSTVPVPALLTDVGRIFVGRDAELEHLERWWKEAAAGERRVALLAGEPGVGKTRLAAELTIRVHDEGGVVLAGRCDEDLGVPYQPFVEALRHFVDHTPDAELGARLGRYGGELARLVPELADRPLDLPPPLHSDPETERYRLFDAVAAWLGATAADDPVLLVVDDLQWAAKPTALLLRHVITSARVARILLVATYRDSELPHHHPLVEVLADLRRRPGIERLALSGLDSAAVAAFLEQAAGHALDDAALGLAQAVHGETDGNPFFVREVLRHLSETGGIAHHDGRWTTCLPIDELGIPEGVRDVVGRRLSRISDGANRALRVAAVVGSDFDSRVVSHAGDFSEEALLSHLEESARCRLVIEGAEPYRHRFAHAIVRDSLYGELSPSRRVVLHRRVAEAIETVHAAGLDDYLPALTHHWTRAGAPAAHATRAGQYATRAGHRAMTQLAHDEAAAYYEQALELLDIGDSQPQSTRRLELLISLGEAKRRAGDPSSRETLLEASVLARRHGAVDGMVQAVLANSRGTFSAIGMVDGERVEALEAAISALGDDDPARRARLLATLAVELLWAADPTRCRRLSDEALNLARRHADPRVVAAVVAMRWATLWDPRCAKERLDLADELLSHARLISDPYLEFWGHWRRSLAFMELGRTVDADDCRQAAERQADELNQPFPRWCVAVSRVPGAIASGRLADADQFSQAIPNFRIPDAEALHLAALAGIRYEQGRLGELETPLRTMADRLPAVPLFHAFHALALHQAGHTDDARSTYVSLARRPPGGLVFDYFAAPTAALLATVAAAVGDPDGAATLVDVITPYADQAASHPGLWFGSFSHHLGVLTATLRRFDEADRHFAVAAAFHDRIGAVTWLARTRLAWAGMLLSRGWPADSAPAAAMLRQAATTAVQYGLAEIERGTAALL